MNAEEGGMRRDIGRKDMKRRVVDFTWEREDVQAWIGRTVRRSELELSL